MFDSKNKMLETKFRSNLILTENINHNLIHTDLWLQVLQKVFYFLEG